ncbi:MAG: flavodoxin family protein [Candidatus Atabeyarchaeum deiterrae]
MPSPRKVVFIIVFGIVGSPKKSGNVDLLVSEVLRGAASQGAETHKIYLNDLHIRPCQSCGVDPYPKHCLLEDDMKVVYSALEISDALVLGSPVYFDSVSAQTKLMIDRINCLMPFVERADGTSGFERRLNKRKRGIFIAVAGTEQEFNTISTTVKGFFSWANVELIESILYPHEDSKLGSVAKDLGKMDQAFQVGVRITGDEAAAKGKKKKKT